MEYVVKILSIMQVTHNVRCIRFKKPEHYNYVPGQATDVSINHPNWVKEKRPFTFTALDSDAYLEFTIKCYTDHNGVTNQIAQLKEGDELIIDDPWGAIAYKGEGYFIAGGAGITPFIAILRQLHKEGRIGDNRLFFSNKTSADIIYERELKELLGDRAVFVVTGEEGDSYPHDFINEAFLHTHVSDFSRQFYICGPDVMIQNICAMLIANGAEPSSVVFEK